MTEISLQAVNYSDIRRSIVDLHQRILKIPNAKEIKTCAKHLGLLHKKILNFRNDTETDLLSDYMVYAFRPNGFNMAEKFLRLNKDRLNAFDQALLSRMSLARYTVFQMDDSNRIDEVSGTDVLMNTQFTLMDHQLAETGEKGMMLAGHIVDLGDFCIQTGATLPIYQALINADEVIKVLERVDADQFVDYFLKPANASKLARAVFSASIRMGDTENVSYRDV